MKASFNVLDRAWIPVRTLEGKIEILGIRQVLSRAHELQEITVGSPMEEYGLYRFLSVFLMDALRPETEIDVEDLLDAGQFDMGRIEVYITQCNSCGEVFDLFDQERPFLQSRYDESIDKKIKPVSVMDCTIPSGNNHTHFDHMKAEKIRMKPEQAARLLISTQLFCTAGAQGYPSGVNASPPYFGVIKERSLFETLVFTLLPLDSIGIVFDDPPVLWRTETGVCPKAEISRTSWLRGMLFPARRVLLVTENNGESIDGIFFSQGENYVNKESWRDPFVAYRTTENGVVPIRPAGYRPIWHNLDSIIDAPGKHASQLLTQYLSIGRSDTVYVTLYGVETNQASYLSVNRYDLCFPAQLASEPDYIELLTLAITESGELGMSLKASLSGISSISESVAGTALQHFYKQCETRFWILCDALVKNESARRELNFAWCNDISTYANDIFERAVDSLNLRAKALTEAVKMRDEHLLKKIRNLKKEASR